MRTSIALAIVGMLALAACGRSDIEDLQRSWLEEQHKLEKRMLEVRNDQIALRREIDPDRALEVADSVSADRFMRADAMLRESESKLNAMDTMIDKHQLARDNAIRADDAPAVATGWAAAKVDYAAAMAALDALDRQNDDIARGIKDIRYRETGETGETGKTGAAGGTGAAGAAGAAGERRDEARDKGRGEIDNTIGRETPDEPE